MVADESDVVNSMISVQTRYFPELQGTLFEIVFDQSFDGVVGRALSGKVPKVILHYSDIRILEPAYRMGLVPVIAHELAHFIDPVDPERIMRERLPAPMMALWEELLKEGYAKCSMAQSLR
jgi:hypothetical protein